MNEIPGRDRPPNIGAGNVVKRWLLLLMPRSAGSVAWLATLTVAGIAVIALAGWVFDLTLLTSFAPQRQAMSIITAICFLLIAAELAFLQKVPAAVREHFILKAPVILVGLVGALTIVLYAISLFAGHDPPVGNIPFLNLFWIPLTRLALLTATLFLFTACALVLLATGRRRAADIAHAMMLPVAIGSFLVPVSYLFAAQSMHDWQNIPVALNTGITFCAVCIAIFCIRPHTWPMRVLTGDHAGGIMARRLLPALLIIPIIFDWLQYKAQVLSLFGQPVGVALLVVANTFFLLCLVWLVARSVNRTDERRRTAEHQFETFFSLSPDMVAIAGYDGYFKQLSPSWEETLGWTREQLASKPYLDFVHPDDTSATLEAGRRLVAGDDIRLFQNRYRHKDGSYRWIEWHAVPVPERQLTYNIARDITERKRAEEVLKERTAELEAINKELESFSYSVSHDLRAPLRAIDGYARMILKKEGDKFDKDTTRRFNDIRLNARMMGQLIDDLLAFSRLGKKHMSISKLGMDAVIMDVWKELQTVNPERDMKLTLNSMPSGYGDRTLIKRVYFNLISNAVKFTKLRGEAHIEAGGYTEGKEDVFYIKDNGVGFDMAYYDKLFGVFQRLHNPDDFEGTGVGLATIQRIIHRHDGRVWAEGKVDEGATFYFSLPRKG